MTSRSGNVITWTSYNYPSGINSPGESVTFQYGPDRQRWQTIYTGSIGTETTYHVGGLLEKVISGGITDYRHYIFAGSEPVAIYSRQSTGTNTLHYALTDHQGSFAGILTNTGTTDVNESFTPYGNRRSATTWSGAPSSSDETAINAVSRWGYTDQFVLGVSMGLNHMNGRVEDAITGRFLSPDPTIPDPGNTQSYNRYSYVNNNPLSLTDPSGFSPFKKCVDVCSGGKLNYDPGSFLGYDPGAASVEGVSGNDTTLDANGGLGSAFYNSKPTVTVGPLAPASSSNGGNSKSSALDPNFFTAQAAAAAGLLVNPLDPSMPQSGWTFQIGISLTGEFFGVDAAGNFGIAFDSSGNVGLYNETGAGLATSPDGAVGLSARISNAPTITDLGGWFNNANIGGGWGPHATGDAFNGTSDQGQNIFGAGFTVGVGAGGASTVTRTWTNVGPSTSFWNVFLNAICWQAMCGP